MGTKFIVITNQKGGVGKTTTAVALASLLNKQGHKSLLIDVDPQCNSTDTFRAEVYGRATLYDLLLDSEPCALEDVIQHTQFGDIIAGDPNLVETDDALYGKENRYGALKAVLSRLKSDYDYEYVIFDTNPSLNTLLRCALVCCDYAVVPCKVSRYAVQGLSSLSSTLSDVKRTQNPDLVIAGILPVDYDGRARVYKETKEALENAAAAMGTKTFNVAIRHAAKVAEAEDQRIPLNEYSPKCKPALDYEMFVKELLEELNNGKKR